MDIKSKIVKSEYRFPSLFSNLSEVEYGLLFYNEFIPDSHDGNHAIIIDTSDFDTAVKQVKEFYLSKKLVPRIYSALINGQLNEITPFLKKYGFIIQSYDKSKYMIHQKVKKLDIPITLDIKRVRKIDDDILNNVFEKEDIDRCRIIFEESLKSENYHLIVAYHNGIPVTTASIEFQQNGVGRVDSVETGIPYRGNGYAHQITKFFVDYHYQHSDDLLYLYSNNPTAIKIYAEAGFTEYEYSFESWSAWIDSL